MDLKSVSGGKVAEISADASREKQAAQGFETLMLSQYVNEMLEYSAPKTNNGGFGEEMFRSLLGNEIARSIVEAGGIGITEQLENALRAQR